MDSIRLAPSSSPHGANAARQKSGGESAQSPSAFSAVLSGLDGQATTDTDPLAPTKKSTEDKDALDPPAHGGNHVIAAATADPHAGSTISTRAAKSSPGVHHSQGGTSASAVAGDVPPVAAGTGLAVPVQDAATPASLALAAAAINPWTGGGLVAQTARIDSATGATRHGVAGTPSRHLPSAKPGANAVLTAAAQPFAQALDLKARPGGLASGAVLPGTPTDPRALPDSTLLQAAAHKVAADSPAIAGDITSLAAAPSLPAQVSAWLTDPHRERADSVGSDRPGLGSASIGQAWTGLGASASVAGGGGVSDGVAASPEGAVAEQVTYWLSENLKNAELTVDHAGQHVDVRVSLAGSEAHVAFRSDQVEIRELLAARMDQLRDLLQGEGLVLSGATVDAGSSGQAGGQGGKSAPNGVQTATVQAAGEVPVKAVRRTLTNSSVDLYV